MWQLIPKHPTGKISLPPAYKTSNQNRIRHFGTDAFLFEENTKCLVSWWTWRCESTTLEEYEKNGLTHCGPVTPYGDIHLGRFWLNQWPSLVKFDGIHLPVEAFIHRVAKILICLISLKIYTLKITATPPGGQWVKCNSNPKGLTHRDYVFLSYSIILAWAITYC